MSGFTHKGITITEARFDGLEDTPGDGYTVTFEHREGTYEVEWWSTRHSSGLDVYDDGQPLLDLTDEEDEALSEAIEEFGSRHHTTAERLGLPELERRVMRAVLTGVGARVRAVSFAPSKVVDDNQTVPPGTEGTVDHLDDMGTVFVKWDNGSGIGLLPGKDDWELL